MECPNCGIVIPKDADRCPTCGTPVADTVNPVVTVSEQERVEQLRAICMSAKPEEVRRLCRDILLLNPDNLDALVMLADMLVDENPSEALTFYRRAVQLAPDPETQRKLDRTIELVFNAQQPRTPTRIEVTPPPRTNSKRHLILKPPTSSKPMHPALKIVLIAGLCLLGIIGIGYPLFLNLQAMNRPGSPSGTHAVASGTGTHKHGTFAHGHASHKSHQTSGNGGVSVADAHTESSRVQEPETHHGAHGQQTTPPAAPAKPAVPRMPDLASCSKHQAEATLNAMRLGLKVSVHEEARGDQTPGTILHTSPSAGERLSAGQRITLTCAAKPEPVVYRLPDCTRRAAAEVKAELREHGYHVTQHEEKSDAVPSGQVIRTVPSAGTTLAPKASVTLVVAQ